MARVYRRGDKWWIDYTITYRRPVRLPDGRVVRRRRVREASDARTKRQAEMALAKRQDDAYKGKYGLSNIESKLFSDYAEEYLDSARVTKKPRSVARDAMILRVHMIPFFSDTHLQEITVDMVDRYRDTRMKAGIKPSTFNRELACLKHMMNMAVDRRYLTVNPLTRYKPLRTEGHRERILSTEEQRALLEHCHGMLKDVVTIALTTGMRQGEILSLKRKDIDLKNRFIFVETSKSWKSRYVPFPESLVDVLKPLVKGLKDENEALFKNYGKTPLDKKLREQYERALKHADIEGATFHDLRHTYATTAIRLGINVCTVQKILGHSDIRMTMRYVNIKNEDLQAAKLILDGKLQEVGTNLSQSHQIDQVGDIVEVSS